MLRSMLLSSFRPFYAPPDDPAPAPALVEPPEPIIKPDVEQAAADPEPEPLVPVVAEPAPAPVETWQDKELRRKHRQLQDEKRRSVELQQQLDDANVLLSRVAGNGAEPEPAAPAARAPAPATDSVPRSEVQAVAQSMVAQREFNQQCNDVEKAGKTAYKDEWPKIADTLTTLGGFTPDEMQGILATDDPAKVLYELGKNPDKYHELKELPPAKRLAAMVKMAIPENRPAPKPSDAPEPVVPVGGRGGAVTAELDDKLSDDDWHKQRDAQRLKRMAARNGNSLRA